MIALIIAIILLVLTISIWSVNMYNWGWFEEEEKRKYSDGYQLYPGDCNTTFKRSPTFKFSMDGNNTDVKKSFTWIGGCKA